MFCCENFDEDSNDHILKFESHRHLTPNFFSRLYPNFAYKKESSVILGMPGAVAFRIGKSYLMVISYQWISKRLKNGSLTVWL